MDVTLQLTGVGASAGVNIFFPWRLNSSTVGASGSEYAVTTTGSKQVTQMSLAPAGTNIVVDSTGNSGIIVLTNY